MAFRSRILFHIALVILLGVPMVLAINLDWRHAFSTDIFDLLAEDDRMPAEASQVHALLREQLSREILLAIYPGEGKPDRETCVQFLETARQLRSFAAIDSLTDHPLSDEASAFLFSSRIELLFPKWLSRVQSDLGISFTDATFLDSCSEWIVSRLDYFLEQPESMVYEPLLPKDPLLLIPEVLEQLDSSNSKISTHSPLLYSVQLSAPPSSQEVYDQLEADLEVLRQWVTVNLGPESSLKDTGFHRFAIESEKKIKSEIFRLNFMSLGFTILIAFVFLRKPLLLFPIFLVVLSSIGCALIITLKFMGTVHIIALVIGSILVGVAVDYCFHILLKREELELSSFSSTLYHIRIPLITSCLSTAFGFSVLLMNPVKAIQQVGVFVCLGLIFAILISSITALAFDFEGKVVWSRNLNFRLPFPSNRWMFRMRWIAVTVAVLVYLLFGRARDNIEDLQIALTDAPVNDAEIRSNMGESKDSSYWITLGDSLQQVIDRQSDFEAEILHAAPQASFMHMASLFPTSREVENYLEFKRLYGTEFAEILSEALDKGGYDSEVFADFWNDWNQVIYRQSTLDTWESDYGKLLGLIGHSLGLLAGKGDPGYWGSTRIIADPKLVLSTSHHTFELAPLKSLNQAFMSYRAGVARSLWISLSVIVLVLFAVFHFRSTCRIVEIPAFAVVITLGIFTLLGEPITFFHLIGVLLGACITLDYAVFAAQPERSRFPISIRTSALTTMASFAALSFSRIPAVMDLGTTVFLITLLGLLYTEWSLQIDP